MEEAAEIRDPDEYIILGDNLVFTRELMQDFVGRSRRLRQCTVCSAKPGLVTLWTLVSTQSCELSPELVKYGLWYKPPERSRGGDVPLIMEPEEYSLKLPMPDHLAGNREARIPITDRVLVQIDHWANLWAANLSILLARAARLRKAGRLRLLGLALRAGSLNRWSILRQINRIGKGCDIHPTAYIEGSTIGDNVMVGAGSVIRLSDIGSGASIGSNVTVELSVVGAGSAFDSGSGAFGAVLYPGTVTSSRIFLSLCGHNTFLADGVFLADYRLDGKNIRVLKNGNAVDTGVIALGSCLGHGVHLGAGCVLEPGRSLPNGLRITPEESRIIRRAGDSIPGHRCIQGPPQEE